MTQQSGASDYFYLLANEIVSETDKALLVQLPDGRHWLPLSQIADAEDYKVGQKNVEIAITKWLAAKLGFEVE